MADLVEVHEVTQAPLDPLLRAFSVDRPSVGGQGEAHQRAIWALDIDGWALGSQGPVASIEIVPTGLEQDPVSRWRLPLGESRQDVAAAHPDAIDSERSGFYRAIGVLGLPREFELRLLAVLPDGSTAPLATVRGSRAPLPALEEAPPLPLIVTETPGADARPLLEALAAEPDIVAVPPSEGQARVGAFWTDVLRTLAEPASYLRQVSHARNLHHPAWWLGEESPSPGRIVDGVLQEWMGTVGVEELARFARDRIGRFYAHLAQETGKRAPERFAERVRPGPTAPLLHDLYPGAREVVIASVPGDRPPSSAPGALVVTADELAGAPQEVLSATLEHAGLEGRPAARRTGERTGEAE